MKLTDYLDMQCVFAELKPADKFDLLAMLADRVVDRYPSVQRDVLIDKLIDREAQVSTGIGRGVAVPHAMIEGVAKTVCMIAHLSAGIDFDAVDGEPVCLVFLLLSPPGEMGKHIKVLARIARMMKSGEIHEAVSRGLSARELCLIIEQEDERHVK